MSSCSITARRSPTARRHMVRKDPAVIRAYLGAEEDEASARRDRPDLGEA